MKRKPSGHLGISLAPFLDLLLCTMGAMIVLLVVINRSSTVKAAIVRAAGKALDTPLAAGPPPIDPNAARNAEEAGLLAEEIEARRDARDELNWRIEHLNTSRDKSAATLRDERLRLSSAEAQVRELTDRLKNLAAAVAELEDNTQKQGSTREQLQTAIAQANAELAAARSRLEQRQAEAKASKTAYAVIPYEGPNRTTRRPIYIECTRDGIYIQPEGVKIVPGDLLGPNGPGNPLASTVRAVREHLLQTAADPNSPDAEPYPLFLVRPDGIIAYYEAKEAMSSWANEIGYQVVDQDWPLAFPTVDPVSKQRAQAALDEARERYRWLANSNSAQRSATTAPKTSYRVSPSGGGLIRENAGPLNNSYAPEWGAEGARATNSERLGFGGDAGTANAVYGAPGTNDTAGIPSTARLGPPGSSVGTGGGYGTSQYGSGIGGGMGNGAVGATRSTGGGPGGAGPGNTYAMLGNGPGGTGYAGATGGGTGSGSGQPGLNGYGGAAGGTGSGAGNSAGASAGSPGGQGAGTPGANGMSGGGSSSGGQTGGSTGGSSMSGGAAGGASGGGASGGGASGGAAGGGSGAGTPSPGASGDQTAALQRQYGDLSQKQTAGATSGDAPQPYYSGQDQRTPPKSIAETRGKNWAVLRNGRGSQPVSRPIRMVCNDREIRILADAAAEDAERTIPFATSTGNTIPDLVAAVEKRIGKWGLAGKGLYWSPELVFDVDPSGTQRYQDLQTLLDDSGWIVRHRELPFVNGPVLLPANRTNVAAPTIQPQQAQPQTFQPQTVQPPTGGYR